MSKPLRLLCAVESVHAAAGAEDASALPRFRMIAYTGAPIEVGWPSPVVIDLSGLRLPAHPCPIRYNHSSYAGVGHTTSIAVVNNQLVAEGLISRATAEADEVVRSAKNGFPWQASVGISVLREEMVGEGDKVSVNGRELVGPLTVVRDGSLDEISFVDLGADSATSAVIAAAQNRSECMDETKESVVTEPKQDAPSASIAASADGKPGDAIQADVARIEAIRRVCGEQTEIAAKAIEEGWSVERAAVESLRASRPRVPRVVADAVDKQHDVMVAGIAWRGGVVPTAEIQAGAKRYRHATLSAIARVCCDLEGVALPHNADAERVVKAAFSTRSFPNVLKDAAHKVLLDGYQSVPRTSTVVARVIGVVDFKPHTLARLTGRYKFEQVAPDGELKHAVVTDQGYTVQAKTYGCMVGLTRQDLINDDLGAFLEIPRQLGVNAARALEDTFWAMVQANANNFFSTAHKNLLESATANLSIDSLGAAVAALERQTDDDGAVIAQEPRYLVVPPELRPLAEQLYSSAQLIVAGQANRVLPANNPYVGRYQPVVTPYLAGNGADSVWYLFADPAVSPAFVVAFLEGRDSPVIEEAAPDPKYLGTLWRGYFDFGVAQVDWRGAVKNVKTTS